MYKKIFVLVILSTLLYADVIQAKLIKISDGDTMIFNHKGNKIKCRVYGIDTPEKFKSKKLKKEASKAHIKDSNIQEMGRISTAYARNKLPISLEYKIEIHNKDLYKRSLCSIYLPNGNLYNEIVIKDGYALVYQKGKRIKEQDLRLTLIQAQEYAKKNSKGLWSSHKDIMNMLSN